MWMSSVVRAESSGRRVDVFLPSAERYLIDARAAESIVQTRSAWPARTTTSKSPRCNLREVLICEHRPHARAARRRARQYLRRPWRDDDSLRAAGANPDARRARRMVPARRVLRRRLWIRHDDQRRRGHVRRDLRAREREPLSLRGPHRVEDTSGGAREHHREAAAELGSIARTPGGIAPHAAEAVAGARVRDHLIDLFVGEPRLLRDGTGQQQRQKQGRQHVRLPQFRVFGSSIRAMPDVRGPRLPQVLAE